MKKILVLLFAFLFSVFTNAQQDINTTFATQMNTVFGSLDKTKVPHGILLDYGMEFTNVPAYNGTLTDSTYADKSSLKQIYNTLLSSRVRELSTAWITPAEYDTRWNSNRTAGVIALSGLYFKYSQFASNALTANKITLSSNKFYDKVISGVWQNPYEELQTFAMAAPIKQYDELSMQVKIPSNIFISNYQNLIASIQIDFDNGQGYVTVPYNQNIAVSYTSYGLKIWKYKLNLTNGTSLYNQSRMKIGKNSTNGQTGSPVPPPCQTCRISATESPVSITATIPYLGGLGTVKLTIDYAGDPNQGLKKPLIVAEGFDLGVILDPEKKSGNFSYSDFRKFLQSSGSELRNLLYEDNKQYDIIYVDWDNGVDYMQRNAYALEAVINYVNARKVLSGSTTKNVILGQSMGGVIARYALADMEQRGVDHKTSLFISHDAPQQGANIPISFQYMFRHLTRQYVKSPLLLYGGETFLPMHTDSQPVSSYLSILDAPASKQLITNFVNSSYTIDNSENTSFYNELKGKGVTNSGGYPVQCRNIAISNGSECGTTQTFNPGDDLVIFQLNKGLSFWGDLLSLVYNPLGGAIGGDYIDRDLYGVAVLGTFPGHSKYNVDFQAKSLYDSSGNQIYKGRVSYTKKILWALNITIDITNVTKNQPSATLPFDTYGGGYFDTKTLAGTVNSPNLVIKDHFGFIPTASALDIGKRNVPLLDVDYKKSYVGAIPLVAPKNSPFANFTTDFDKNPNAHNKQHISFDPRNGKWLASELNALSNPILIPEKTDCSYICSDVQIAGNALLCGSGSYSVPLGATYSWSITDGENLVTLSGNGTNTVTLNPSSASASGKVTLSVYLGNEICGYKTLTKSIIVGKPSIEIKLTSDSNYATIDLISANNVDITQQGITSTTWTKIASTNSGNGGGSGFSGFGNGPNFNWTITLVITATNACGTTSITRVVTCAPPSPCVSTYNLVAKSSNGYVANKIIDPCAGTASLQKSSLETTNVFDKEIISAKLYDIYGAEIRSYKKNDYFTDGIKNGIYILKVQIKDVMLTKKIIIN
ncbi:hypothetical protein C8C85_2337 [Flavobacterium sp. 103]|uniref:T9SS type A sorting domain-containing protein n=1 Tax=Flavobacterium sp. 103 TaxID=2135624 RepID=UPI000D5D9671|nr:T9SS type A sorting domain-containing protein [Flavobacterium sp. 103]PVX46476.1 hypothetical protein C8C85_2337 [Flavobacterium sp. 103]